MWSHTDHECLTFHFQDEMRHLHRESQAVRPSSTAARIVDDRVQTRCRRPNDCDVRKNHPRRVRNWYEFGMHAALSLQDFVVSVSLACGWHGSSFVHAHPDHRKVLSFCVRYYSAFAVRLESCMRLLVCRGQYST
jgi:hypothetical protein